MGFALSGKSNTTDKLNGYVIGLRALIVLLSIKYSFKRKSRIILCICSSSLNDSKYFFTNNTDKPLREHDTQKSRSGIHTISQPYAPAHLLYDISFFKSSRIRKRLHGIGTPINLCKLILIVSI